MRSELAWVKTLDEMRLQDLATIQQLETRLAQWSVWHPQPTLGPNAGSSLAGSSANAGTSLVGAEASAAPPTESPLEEAIPRAPPSQGIPSQRIPSQGILSQGIPSQGTSGVQ
uniref:Uncharacterized protein n=1 Tax=Haptolina ericina TaxID=156174 RepID=A0A7S3C3T3_9EUKA|mmetsp:Transcript_73540/g.163409  ORF Transcript_73540/g.163409 Transcript_73540/m.163409 type:complete len:113 (+) Transcript_73540:176-514(+)